MPTPSPSLVSSTQRFAVDLKHNEGVLVQVFYGHEVSKPIVALRCVAVGVFGRLAKLYDVLEGNRHGTNVKPSVTPDPKVVFYPNAGVLNYPNNVVLSDQVVYDVLEGNAGHLSLVNSALAGTVHVAVVLQDGG